MIGILFLSLEPVYKSSCALTLHAISHYSPDVLKGHAVVALPLAFLGMHQAPGPDEEKGESHDATLFSEVWQENVPGELEPTELRYRIACRTADGATILFEMPLEINLSTFGFNFMNLQMNV